jgi:dihydroorotate dehydrogenase (fumarate)
MADLRTIYLGLDLDCPIVASASPLTGRLDTLRQLAEAGAGAVVLPSLFEEDLDGADARAADVLWHTEERAGEATAYLEKLDERRPDAYLELIRSAKRELGIPIIASLNGSTPGGWTRYAELLQQAGADAIELNVYGMETDLYASSGAVEERVLRIVHAVRHVVTVPVAVKLTPFYSAFAHFAQHIADAGADGLVLFNRFVQPEIDVESLVVVPELRLSTPDELRLPLRWIAVLRGRVDADLAATSGIHTGKDVARAILAGADVAMVASTLLVNGIGRVTEMRTSLDRWLETHALESVGDAHGRLSQVACGNPRAYERAQYVQAVDALSAK